MRSNRRNVDLVSIEYANDRAKQSIAYWRKRLKGVDEDPQRQARLDAAQCALCFYEQSRIGGAACTSIQCAFCDKWIHSGNTCVDIMCVDCAKKAGLCCHCGCDLNLKSRRKRELPEKTETIER